MARTTRASHQSLQAPSSGQESLSKHFIPLRPLHLLSSILLLMAVLVPLWLLRQALYKEALSRQLPEGSSGSLHPEMLILPTGTFMMGSPVGEADRDKDETQYHVTLTQRFAISLTEVTQGQFRRVMGFNPSKERDEGRGDTPKNGGCAQYGVGDELPVACVTFTEAAEYANKVSDIAKLEKCYEIEDGTVEWPRKLACKGYRLPTEAEWEYAARADTQQRYAETDSDTELCKYANLSTETCKDDGYEYLAPVRHYQPNGWGLYDMSGNVWEWVWDWYEVGGSAAVTNPTGPDEAGSYRAYRGGSGYVTPRFARVANRGGDEPSRRYGNLGFRVARSYP